jgi:hypothetical protein
MEQVRQQEENEEPRPVGADCFVLSARSATWYLSTEMARHVEQCLDGQEMWLSFVDLNGSRVRLRTHEVEYLAQSTAEQRAADRTFHRAMSRERKADRDWGEDE